MFIFDYKKIIFIKGPAYGVTQPSIIINLILSNDLSVNLSSIDSNIIDFLKLHSIVHDVKSDIYQSNTFFSRLSNFIQCIQLKCGLNIHHAPKLLGLKEDSKNNKSVYSIAVSLAAPYSEAKIDAIMDCFSIFRELTNTEYKIQSNLQLSDKLTSIIKTLTANTFSDTNTRHFINSAIERNIPYFRNNAHQTQFGWGSWQCVFNSTILETTSSYAVAVARDKFSCLSLLRQSGLPAPQNIQVSSIQQALKGMQSLAYPVVIKPQDLDGGVGVTAGITDEEQLTSAFELAKKHSQKILLEQHIAGKDYRLIVFDQKVIWAVARLHAGVIGDAKHTIQQLIDITNQDHRRGYDTTSTLRPITLTPEALKLIEKQGYALNDVPQLGVYIQISSTANISSGGTPEPVTDKVHPDNVKMIIRAVNLLALDLAGVDFISPDIAEPWYKNNAAIIEINAQPQLVAASQSHLYSYILTKRVRYNGRIPVIVVWNKEHIYGITLQQQLSSHGIRTTLASRVCTLYPDQQQGIAQRSSQQAARAGLMQRDTDCLIWQCDDDDSLSLGLPVDFYDILIVGSSDNSFQQSKSREKKLELAALLPHCTYALYYDSAQSDRDYKKEGLPDFVKVNILNNNDSIIKALNEISVEKRGSHESIQT